MGRKFSIEPLPAGVSAMPGRTDRQVQQLAALLMLFGDGSGSRSAARCLAEFGSLSAVLAASETDLCARAELPAELAHCLHAVADLYRTASLETISGREPLKSFDDLRFYALRRLRGRQTEQVIALLLDCRSGLIREHIIADGTIQRIDVQPREVARAAMLYNAAAVILLHNHPSGDPTPSAGDIDFTKRLANALAMLGIALHDHVVVGNNETVSFRALGAL